MFLLIQNYRGKTYLSSDWKNVQEYFYVHQGKRLLEQKCSSNPLLLLCVSLLTYCNHAWSCTYYTNLKQLFVIQKKALQIICGKIKRESTENIFSELKFFKFADINAYLTGRFMHKWYTDNVPGIFSDSFQCNNAVHGYSTRQSEHLHVPLERSNLSQFCIRCSGVVVWNAILKNKIYPDTSEFVFAKALKPCILDGKLTL